MAEESTEAEIERHASRIIAIPDFLNANPLLILGLPYTATFDECKQSYRRLSYLFHPDKQGGHLVSDYVHQNLRMAFPGRNAFEEVFKLLVNAFKLVEDPRYLSVYSQQLQEATKRRKPRKTQRNKPSKLFKDHDTAQYKNFSSSCSLLAALSGQPNGFANPGTRDIISQLKSTISKPTKATPRRVQTVDELLRTNPEIASLNERVKASVTAYTSRHMPQPAAPVGYTAVTEEEDDIETVVLNNAAEVVASITDIQSSKKRKLPTTSLESLAQESAPKRQKVQETAVSCTADPSASLLSLSSFSALLDTLPPELRRPFEFQ